jgi:hypothetical protein
MRWLWSALPASAVALVTLSALSGCGGGGATDQSGFPPGDDGGPVVYDATTNTNLNPDATVGGDGAGPACTPRTCTQAGATCGQVADGCGGLTAVCGTCSGGDSCGGGGVPSQCGGAVACVPKTCADPSISALCGQQADGCGGVVATPCVTCNAPQTCGGGGTPNQCGGTAACVPFTTSQACALPDGGAMNCGVMADGCGNLLACSPTGDAGAACPAGETCGGSGVPNQCGASNIITLSDGGTAFSDAGPSACVPFTEPVACAGSGGVTLCGPVSNGCGSTIACPVCTGSDTCGGGGIPSVCGHPTCTPIPEATACAFSDGGAICGLASNGCGGTWTCPACTGGTTCGGGGVPSACGSPPCTAATSCPLNVNCGPWPNGCGGIINSCGTCTGSDICGGGGVPSECGNSSAGAGCDAGLVCDLPTCADGGTTTLSGIVYDPAHKNPLYDVVVYVPNLPIPLGALTHGVPSCASCSSLYLGSPVTATTTGTDGSFMLTNVPVPTSGNVPVVIQVGKWRRQFTWSGVNACNPNPASATVAALLQLPGKENSAGPVYDDLPQIAVSTGGADSMECLFERIGFSTTEYTSGSGGTGHIHIFTGSSQGASTTAGTHNSAVGPSGTAVVSKSNLWKTAADLDPYDIVILSCEGEETRGNAAGGSAGNGLSTTDLQNLTSYATNGGRVFASHFHYAWFNQGGAGTFGVDTLATWTPNADNPNTGYSTGAYSGPIYNDEDGGDSVNAKIITTYADGGVFPRGSAMKQWLGNVGALATNEAPTGELFISNPRFNVYVSPTDTASQAWLVPDNAGYVYYDENDNPQTLGNSTQYMSFDTPVGGTGDAGSPYCGRAVYSDLHVGAASGDYPGFESSGTPVAPTNCEDVNLSAQEKALEFMLLDLASCVTGDTNLPTPPPAVCSPLTACPSSYECGEYPNGCGDGGLLQCGTCEGGASCIEGKCIACVPATTCPTGVTCGLEPDGCGGSISCGTCAATAACVSGTCTTGCTPATACPSGITCGPWPDGCGGTINCGDCTAPDSCGGAGTPGVCGEGDANACNPFTCLTYNPPLYCGPAGNGCGGLLDCGECDGGTCGGGGTPGVCGSPTCTPATCTSLGASCGQEADGCGNLTPVCGTCTGNATCGGSGTPNQCGIPGCAPLTCAQAGANCGPVANGCGGIMQCGTCTPPDTCGGGGTVSVCGNSGPK